MLGIFGVTCPNATPTLVYTSDHRTSEVRVKLVGAAGQIATSAAGFSTSPLNSFPIADGVEAPECYELVPGDELWIKAAADAVAYLVVTGV